MKPLDIIIVGGSYAGLAAGMALGRALKNVLIIDDGKPCNRQTPHSHNFLTNDGKTPAEIASIAGNQVSRYQTVKFLNGTVTNGKKTENGFEVRVSSGEKLDAKNLIFATGIKDLLPEIEGLSDCWGITVVHCPYCHGYELRNEKTAIFGNGNSGFEFARLISNWTKDLTLLTNGTSSLTAEQIGKLQNHHIQIVDKVVVGLEHNDGHLQNIVFNDGTKFSATVMYAPSPFEQQSKIPGLLGCQLTEEGYIQVDSSQETTVAGIYACGDNSSRMRTVANAVATGTTAGISLSKKMISVEF